MTHAYGKNLLPATVGFDRLLSTMEEFDKIFEKTKTPTYPPYNIVKFDDESYEIQIAVAGFSKEDVDIQLNQNVLTVNGVSQKVESSIQYLHHGLASRDFRHTFRLSDNVIVDSADMINGVLKINLKNVIPEEKKPRKIQIGNSEKEKLLVES